VFTAWPGRSPQDVEDQVTYPLTTALLGVPKVRTIRSTSMFGFSSIYVIFHDDADFYWSRSRVLEKLNSLPMGTLPADVRPALGPDATGMGQIFWYTLEGRTEDGSPAGGWDLHELRTIQDWIVRFQLMSVEGVSEVASIGGFVQEYQVDVDPDAMRAYGVTLDQVFMAIRASNADVGARTIEINRVEYVIRGRGYIREVDDIRRTVIAAHNGVPVYVENVATVALGPALRRGVLDKNGSEAVGGVVVVRYGENPLAVIGRVRDEISRIADSLPRKAVIRPDADLDSVAAWCSARHIEPWTQGKANSDALIAWHDANPEEILPDWLSISRVHIEPFYDRTDLIYETLGTLNTALEHEVLITIIVVLVMVMHLRSSLLISAMLPLAILMTFIGMKAFGVDANVVALSGIAIAIGTIVDMGIILCENILKHLDEASPDESRLEVIYRASHEVGSAVLTAIATTVVSFLPIFFMIGAEGKLFKPLAWTKTLALIASVVIALTILPAFAWLLFRHRKKPSDTGTKTANQPSRIVNISLLVIVWLLLTHLWMPLGLQRAFLLNALFVGVGIGSLLGSFYLFMHYYERILRWCLAHKLTFISIPGFLLVLGILIWQGIAAFVPPTRDTALDRMFPGLAEEFMPRLDEGSFLYMPTTSFHASIGEAVDAMQKQDRGIASVPEVDRVVGKLGRVQSPLDPAPISMMETVILYKSEYITDRSGKVQRFRHDGEDFVRGVNGELIPDAGGEPFRQWRDHIRSPEDIWTHIRSPEDIWTEIETAAKVPGSTSASPLGPIETRRIMLQTGISSSVGIRIEGPDLETIEAAGIRLEQILRDIPSVKSSTVRADRIVGKPYLEIQIDREAAARHGVPIRKIQDTIEVAVGGKPITTTVEGRERYPVRVRYKRELRNTIEEISRILIPTGHGAQIPLEQVADIEYVRGPQSIKGVNARLVGYVTFSPADGSTDIDAVHDIEQVLDNLREEKMLHVGPVTLNFVGT
jgi:Cu(I)/Ag(I) efflux system membrane protein CusA/SilA